MAAARNMSIKITGRLEVSRKYGIQTPRESLHHSPAARFAKPNCFFSRNGNVPTGSRYFVLLQQILSRGGLRVEQNQLNKPTFIPL
jgi:hypothetical protein